MMLWTKPSKGTFEFKKMTPIDPLTKVEIRTTDEGYKMIHLTTSQGLFVFKTDSAEDAESWLSKINESKNFVTPGKLWNFFFGRDLDLPSKNQTNEKYIKFNLRCLIWVDF